MKPHAINPMFPEAKPIRLRLDGHENYKRKQRVWRMWLEWQRQIISAFYPATGGSEHLMHNWHRCNTSNPADMALADWIKDSTWGRLRRIEAKLARHDEAREHMRHTPGNPDGFWPYWCQLCKRNN